MAQQPHQTNTFIVARTTCTHAVVREDLRRARFVSPDELAQLDLAPLIDHTLLTENATADAHARLCDEAMHFGFASVCVRSNWVAWCARHLGNSAVKPITVVSFPHGSASTTERIAETRHALDEGAQEIDVVITLDALRGGDHNRVLEDIASIVTCADQIPVKVILEMGILKHAEKIIGCALAKAAGAAYVKTSTGFAGDAGATVEDVQLMRQIVGTTVGVKASGGIRSAENARAMIAAGATRLGTSASVRIVRSRGSQEESSSHVTTQQY